MRAFALLLLYLLLGMSAYAQEITYTFHALPAFQSNQEKEAFEQFQPADLTSRFSLLYAIKPSPQGKQAALFAEQVHRFTEELRPKIEKQKKPEKKIKKIHKEVHQTFLKKYVLKNYFPDIFSKGEYNCVSATALYGLVLEQLGIPFTLKETPTHVFLLAYPETERIALESTDPQVGYLVFDHKFKSQYIAQLRKMKLISEQEFQSKSLETIFEETYFDNQDISFQELIALQYYNDGIYKLEEEAYEAGLQQFEKAYQLYPSSRIAYLIYNSTILAMEKKTYSDSLYIDHIARLSRLEGIVELKDVVKGEFARFTLDQLSNKSQNDYYTRMYHKLVAQLNDSLLINDLAHIYHYEKSRVAYNKGEFSSALEHIEKAYQLFPDDSDNQALLNACLGQRLNTLSSLDEQTLLVENFVNTYPKLRENNMIYSQLLQLYLMQFGQAYELGQEKKGKKYKQQFENTYKQGLEQTEGYLLDARLIGRAYSVAAVHYFRKGQTTHARQLLNKGLEYAPNNMELLQRKQMIR